MSLNSFAVVLIFRILLACIMTDGKVITHGTVSSSFTPSLGLTTATPSVTHARVTQLTAKRGLNIVEPPKNGTSVKRDIKHTDLSGAASAKSYDPPPEYYRGPGSASTSSSSSAASYYNGDSATAGFASKPFTFPNTNERHKYDTDSSNYLANSYNNWQQNKAATNAAGLSGIEDRISIKHYGTAAEPLTGDVGYGSRSGYGGGAPYAYEGHPYVTATHYNDYPATSGQHVQNHLHIDHQGHSYYNGGGEGEGIPFDVYGVHGHHTGAGDEYAYSYNDVHEPPVHKGNPEWSRKALLAKSFLIPLASAAVLGIAAALISNPLLLQLGTVSGGFGVPAAVVGKRRRRDLRSTTNKSHEDKADLAEEVKVLTEDENENDDDAFQQAYRAQRPLVQV